MDNQALICELRDMYISKYPECQEKLGRGYSRAEIEAAITKICPIPQPLIDIYSCIGGENSNFSWCLDFPVVTYYPVELDKIDYNVESYKEYLEVLGYPSDLVVFLEDGFGWSIAIRTLPNDESIWKLPKAEPAYKISTNFERLLLTEIECCRQGAYYIDPDDEDEDRQIDWELAEEIRKKIDPDLED